MYKQIAKPSDRIQEALKAAGMKQAELVELTGISKGSLSSYLSGRYEPKQSALLKMGQALNVSEMWLAGYDVPMERPAAQKENDALAAVVLRARQDKAFKELITELSKLNPDQVQLISSVINQFTPAPKTIE